MRVPSRPHRRIGTPAEVFRRVSSIHRNVSFEEGIPMKILNRFAAFAALTGLACTSLVAVADDHGYTEGIIVNVARIRTVDGKFDDYMRWLSTTWKHQQEASKKAGYLLSYEVIGVEPRTPDDPDLLLVTR